MTNQRHRYDSAADAAELEAIERRAQKLDRLRARIASERRRLADRRRHVWDRIRKRAAREVQRQPAMAAE